MGTKRHSHWSEGLRRLLAAGGAVLVFALGLFAASPVLHAQLHHHVDAALEDGCAIVLFAGGVSMPLVVTAIPPRTVEWQDQRFVASVEIFLDSPRYLLRPERGPPVA